MRMIITLVMMLLLFTNSASAGIYNQYPPGGTATGNEIIGPVLQSGRDVSLSVGKLMLAPVLPTNGTAAPLPSLLSGGTWLPGLAVGTTASNASRSSTFNGLSTVYGAGLQNAFVGIADNNSTSSGFPTGVTGYGLLESPGNQVFGLFARADAKTPGTATNEMNTFNYCGPGSTNLPPNEGFGTPDCNAITLQLVPYGNYDSSIGLQLGPGVNDAGTSALHYQAALYMRPNAANLYDMFIDSDGGTSDNATGLVIKRNNTAQHIRLITQGTDQPNYTVMSFSNVEGQNPFVLRQSGEIDVGTIKQTGSFYYPSSVSATSVGVAGAASPPPSNPTGYIQIYVGSNLKKIPYYEP